MRRLSYREDGLDKVAFDYAGLGERHLGSIYEGLLEHRLTLADDTLTLTNDKGERKTSGAYYTPAAWVTYIVANTLAPVLERLEAQPSVTQNVPDAFAASVLSLNVCDPAMGSGHFLVEATTVLAEAAAAHPTTAPRPLLAMDGTPLKDDSGEPLCTQEAKLAYWKRRIVESCIYGVDYNPLAVELAKLSLWLETVDRVPLNFLDHHLRCGNSLIGTTLAALPNYPDLKKKKAGRKEQLSLGFNADLQDALTLAIHGISEIEAVPTDTHAAAKQKEKLWREISGTVMPRFRAAADLWLAPWFGCELGYIPFIGMFDSAEKAATLRDEFRGVLDPLRPFHWEMEFPDIFFAEDGTPKKDAGFDAVVGNPPWERIKLQQNEFFTTRAPEIALASPASKRKSLIAALPKSNPALWREYQAAQDRTEQILCFVHDSGFYPLMGRGDTNYYAVFAEKALRLTNSCGRVGILVPSGIATDDTTKAYFQQLVLEKRLAEVLDFENKEKIFEDVHRSFKFSILLLSGANAPQKHVKCGFFLHDMSDLEDVEKVFTLAPEDFTLFNPNTLTCPIFRSRRAADLTRKIYRNAPILIDNRAGHSHNPWGVSFLRMFDMTNDSGLFVSREKLADLGCYQDASDAGNVFTRGSAKYWPLYEGKMVQMYDHRAAGITINLENVHRPAQEQPVTLADHQDPDFAPTPQFWIDAKRILPSATNAPSLLVESYKQAHPDEIKLALLFWFLGHYLNAGCEDEGRKRAAELFPGDLATTKWRQGVLQWGGDAAAKAIERNCPLTEDDLALYELHAPEKDWVSLTVALMKAKSWQWMLGFKSVTAPTNVRSFVCSVLPPCGVGNSMPLIKVMPTMASLAHCLVANLSSYVLDFAARTKIGGQNLNFFIVEQFPVLPPEKYDEVWHGVKLIDFIRPRVLELCYTAHDLKGFAEDLDHHGAPFKWDEECRFHLRCQLDALFFHLYGLTREEAGEILETFPIVKRQDEALHHGKFRTKDVILAYYNAYAGGNLKARVKG